LPFNVRRVGRAADEKTAAGLEAGLHARRHTGAGIVLKILFDILGRRCGLLLGLFRLLRLLFRDAGFGRHVGHRRTGPFGVRRLLRTGFATRRRVFGLLPFLDRARLRQTVCIGSDCLEPFGQFLDLTLLLFQLFLLFFD